MAIGDFGERPFGLREVIITETNGGAHALDAERVVAWQWIYDAANLEGEDRIVEVGSRITGYTFNIEDGGISLQLYAALAGGTLSATGATDYYLRRDYDDEINYLQIRGRAIAEDGGDMEITLKKCKVTSGPDGRLEKGVFYLTECSGVGIADASADKRFIEIRQKSVAAALS